MRVDVHVGVLGPQEVDVRIGRLVVFEHRRRN
jgi:hypothetical protein